MISATAPYAKITKKRRVPNAAKNTRKRPNAKITKKTPRSQRRHDSRESAKRPPGDFPGADVGTRFALPRGAGIAAPVGRSLCCAFWTLSRESSRRLIRRLKPAASPALVERGAALRAGKIALRAMDAPTARWALSRKSSRRLIRRLKPAASPALVERGAARRAGKIALRAMDAPDGRVGRWRGNHCGALSAD